ncbi:hypothetical protein BASA83_007821 [Batrachochytrium salamandrivorans]|nr:hypothetical protein BASA62_004682 [Batrachochytrium salamandrivorans]KAH9270145.1 hypothetical protein BASA83_007821 [Batrachochytrium salamandrivorans]
MSTPSSHQSSDTSTAVFRFPTKKLSIYDYPSTSITTGIQTNTYEEPASNPQNRLSILSRLTSNQDQPNDLELLIRKARIETTAAFASTRDQAQSLVNHWLVLEKCAQGVVDKYHEPTENYLPGLIYVTIAGFAGSIVTKNRFVLFRLLAPAVGSLAAFGYHFPATLQNIAKQRDASAGQPFKFANLSIVKMANDALDKAAKAVGVSASWINQEKK